MVLIEMIEWIEWIDLLDCLRSCLLALNLCWIALTAYFRIGNLMMMFVMYSFVYSDTDVEFEIPFVILVKVEI